MAESVPETDALVMPFGGELDIETAPAVLAEGLEALALPWVKHLVLDLGEVTFVDSTALGVLIDLRQRAKAAGIEFSLDRVPAKVRRVIQISGLANFFTIVPAASGA